MSTLSIASWNINSVRLRIGLVAEFFQKHQPDVLCLQETKVENGSFPEKAFREMGYEHMAINGMKAYHGVATVSRLPIEKHSAREFCGKGDTRHVAATVKGVDIHNFYVPAGGDEPDPAVNDKFQHKLDFLTEMEQWMKGWKQKTAAKRVMLGDLNIAPLEHDVWSHKQLLKVVSHTPIEVEHLDRVMKAGRWHDPVRAHRPEPEKLFSWWSYRSKDWTANNRGRRLDHVWVSPALADGVTRTDILTDWRSAVKPSDHCPVMVEMKV